MGLGAYLWWHINRYKNYVKSLGLPIDRTIHWMNHKTNFTGHDVNLMKKFGTKNWVEYSAAIPTLVIGEPDIIKDIMVKHFDSFPNRFSSIFSDYDFFRFFYFSRFRLIFLG
jgi:hypothetical protein